ncbi:MAG: hypothetical protein GWO02_10080, partial [Gammaproteobacteria bacterium]|nr:hypothetical protein [Gammaproteobacteria bacterium]
MTLGPLRLMAYSAPSLATSVAALPMVLFVPAFYADDLGVPLAAVGTAIALSRLLDVVTDPLIGTLSDRMRIPFGRRKPWSADLPVLALENLRAWRGFILHLPPDLVGAALPRLHDDRPAPQGLGRGALHRLRRALAHHELARGDLDGWPGVAAGRSGVAGDQRDRRRRVPAARDRDRYAGRAARAARVLMREGDTALLIANVVVRGPSFASIPFLANSIAADVIDVDTLESGESRSGLFFAAWGMVIKLSLALGVVLATSLPAVLGYEPSAESITPRIPRRLMMVYGV